MAYRITTWVRTPQPGAITIFPAPKEGRSTFFKVLKESFLFPGIFRGDKLLWVFAWLFHITLAFIFIGHVRVFMDFPKLWTALGINADKMSAISGGIAGILIAIFALLLLLRRAAIVRVREITNFPDIFALILILAIIMTGNAMRFGEHFELNEARVYFSHLFTFSVTSTSIPQSGMFALHFLLAQILIMFIPFSKILHFGGIFFTQTVLRRA